ncbi:hypothetical protein BC828DRAFT_394875 [Blastocladiella britannica]|nr:hypothetical protein BC828DRAFT_394875 [Blastocladiella britannica]
MAPPTSRRAGSNKSHNNNTSNNNTSNNNASTSDATTHTTSVSRSTTATKETAPPTAPPRMTSGAATQHNARVLDFARSSFAAVAGSTAGILGLTGLQGFGFYAAASLLLAAVLVLVKCVRVGAPPAKFFANPAYELVVEGVSASGLFAYVLFWTMLNGVIRIYG